jgi:hypothetical protein
MFGGDLSRLFAIKCIMDCNPLIFLVLFSVTVTMILSYLIKIIEGPVYLVDKESRDNMVDYRDLGNCAWYVLISMATGN